MPKLVDDTIIFKTSIQKVIENGYAGATTKSIAQEAGISEVTLFRRYGRKAELIKKAVQATVEASDFDSASAYTGYVENDLLRVVRAYQALADRSGRFFPTIIAEIPRYPELSKLLEIPNDMVTKIGKLITKYQKRGVLRKEHPVHAVAALLGPLNIASMIQQAPFNSKFPPLNLENHVRQYLMGRVVNKG